MTHEIVAVDLKKPVVKLWAFRMRFQLQGHSGPTSQTT